MKYLHEQFENFVNSLKIGDKLYEYSATTREISVYTVEYTYINYKVHEHTFSEWEMLLFVKNKKGKVIKMTYDDAKWVISHLYKSLDPIKNIIKDELTEIKEDVAWRTKKLNRLQNLYDSI